MNARLLALLFAAGCLAAPPLLADDDTASAAPSRPKGPPTIGSLAGKQVPLPDDIPISNADQRARENYRAFLKESADDPRFSSEALRRLGDLELEGHEDEALKGGGGQLNAATYTQAVKLYQQLLTQYPDYPRRDAVLYQLARAQESGGDALAALATLDQIVAKYPQTPLMEEVQFRRGEILFSHERYTDAEKAYTAVLALDAVANKPGEFHEQALYKKGWSLYKLDRYEDCLQPLFTVLDETFGKVDAANVDPFLDEQPRPTRELVSDTLRVMALSLSSLDAQRTLSAQLKARNAPSYGHLLYLSLSALYMDQKRYSDAAAVLIGFVDAEPLHPRAPYLHMQAVADLEQGKFPAEALAARDSFTHRFGLDQPFWQAQPIPPTAPVNAPVVGFLKDSLWTLAQNEHHLAQAKDATPADRLQHYRAAADGYRRYLAYFPQDPQAAEVNFLLGETQFQSADYAGAVNAYETSAYQFPQHAHSAEAGYASLLAYQKQEATLGGADKSAWHRRSIDAELKFAKTYPDDARATAVRLDAASGLFALGALPEAIDAANPLIDYPHATVEQRRTAGMIVGQAYFDSGDFAHAESTYVEVRNLDAASGKKDPDLSERIAASIYRQGEQARKAGQNEQAAADFLRVGKTVPDAKIRATADYDAAQSLLAAGKTADAIPVLEAFRAQNPNNSLVDAASANLALAYAKSNDTANAAREFERIADNPRVSEAERREALQQAARLYNQRKDEVSEARVLTAYVKRYPDAFDQSIEAQQRLIELAGSRHDGATQLDLSRKLVAYDAAGGAHRTDRSKYLAAHAMLKLAEPARDAFLLQPLNAPLKNSMKKKKALMETALAGYAKAADYGVADAVTASTYETAEIYNSLAKALNASERPKGLDKEAREQYDLLLQEQAFPFEEKAIEIHEVNVRRASQGLYDDSVRKSYASLARLKPARYVRPDKEERYVDAIR